MLSSLLPFAGLFVLIFLVEIALFWASTALGSVEVNAGKLLAGSFLAALAWAGAAYGVLAFLGRSEQPLLAPENRLPLILGSLAGLAVSWAVPAVLFVPILPVSVPRGMLISVFQLLLRLFLYSLIGAVVMVVLAFLQIRYGPEKRTEAPTPAPRLAAPLS
jgi:hypothetical protein